MFQQLTDINAVVPHLIPSPQATYDFQVEIDEDMAAIPEMATLSLK